MVAQAKPAETAAVIRDRLEQASDGRDHRRAGRDGARAGRVDPVRPGRRPTATSPRRQGFPAHASSAGSCAPTRRICRGTG